MPRTQINFRVDTELLAAIKAKCEADGISITEFLTDAAITALGIERMERTTTLSPEALSGLIARIAEVENRLAYSLVSLEEKETIENRLAQLEAQQQGELAA